MAALPVAAPAGPGGNLAHALAGTSRFRVRRAADQVGDPPSYRAPRTLPGHTRHYLPDLEHRKGETGRTDLTLDPFLAVSPKDDLLVQWDAELPSEQRQALAKLAELLPYLGRAESACEAGSWTANQCRTRHGGERVPRTAQPGPGCSRQRGP